MRVLVAHNFYSSKNESGENSAVLRDIRMLSEGGQDVRQLVRHSDDINARELARAGFGVMAPGPARELADLVQGGWRPDVLHVHNVRPLLTTSIVRQAIKLGIPVVQTLHNYRRTCAGGMHFRKSKICEDCSGHLIPLPALLHGCYRKSRIQTVPVALNLVVDKSLWAGLDAHIVLSGFMRERLIAGGVPPEAIVIRPTSVPDPGPVTEPGDGLLFIGRLSEEKGVLPLLEAWRLSEASRRTSLTIIGGGPQLDEVKRRGDAIPGVKVLGRVSASVLSESMLGCAAVVLPSLCYEGFPTVATEAFAHGRPVIASETPNARFFVGDAGWIAPPAAQEFASAIDKALTSRSDIVRYAENGRRRYEAEMTVEQSMDRLMRAYEVAIHRCERERAG